MLKELFIGNAFAFEAAADYRHVGGSRPLNTLGASAGLRIFLMEKFFKKMLPHEFHKLH